MEQFVTTTDGVRICWQVDGAADAPALLLVNSIGSTREMWARNISELAKSCRVIRYDARGHGRSSSPPGDYTIDQLGRDAVAVLDAAGAASAAVCGISLGGLTAMWLGLHAADRVTHLVLANTAARIGSLESWSERIALVRERGMRAVADRAMQMWFTPAFAEREPDTVHRFREMVSSCSPDGYLGCCAALRDADLRGDIARIPRPVLVIAGTADQATPPAGAEFIQDRIPGARLAAFDCAHLSNVERDGQFSAAVLNFLFH